MSHPRRQTRAAALLAACVVAGGLSANAQQTGQSADLAGSWVQSDSTSPGEFVVLELVTFGDAVCGNLSSATDGGDTQQSSYVVGRAVGDTATIEFASYSGDRVIRRTASLAARAGKLELQVEPSTAASAAEPTWPKTALSRQIWPRNSLLSIARWCGEHWPQITQGRFRDITLQP